jgi:type II secretory pathway component GspD/PulD (secretin)
VTPVVTENEYISMKVKPEISEVTGFTDDNIPYTSRRSVETNVIVKNGETLAIGGLVRETEIETVTKIPLLGDIPLLGHLFRSTSKQKQKKNLVVFLTPKIVKVRELSENLTLVQGEGVKEKRFIEKTKSGVSKIEAQTNGPQSSSIEGVLENLSDSERYGIKEELQKIQKQQLINDLLK